MRVRKRKLVRTRHFESRTDPRDLPIFSPPPTEKRQQLQKAGNTALKPFSIACRALYVDSTPQSGHKHPHFFQDAVWHHHGQARSFEAMSYDQN